MRSESVCPQAAEALAYFLPMGQLGYSDGMEPSLLSELRDNPFYLYLYQMAREEPLQHVLEIGSASGSGSTRILVEALSQRQPAELYCLEAHPEQHRLLSERYRDLSWVHCLPYFASVPVEYPDEATLWEFYKNGDTVLRRYSFNEVSAWLASEQALYAARAHDVSGVEWIKQTYGIEHFDLAVLDGAEFTGERDLELVYGARILILDDVMTYKNRRNYQQLLNSPDYVLIQDQLKWQHGTAVFKRREPKTQGLSVIVHTRNASALLPDCLASVSWADELIVVDMESTDDTVSVSEAHGARVARHVPVICVDEARNWGLSLAKFSWTLVLDADERIPGSLAERIREVVEVQPADGFWLPRRNHFFGQAVAGLFPDYQLRLFKSQAAYWRGLVHELPILKGRSLNFPPEAESAIEHYSYATVADFCQRSLRYAETLWEQHGRYPAQTMPTLAHELRDRYELAQQKLSRVLAQQPLNNLDWLVSQLYLFNELAMTGTILERSGQLTSGSQQTKARLSAYSYLKNAERFDYPFIESLMSVMDVCDEVVVSYASDSEDDTTSHLQKLAQLFPKLKLFETDVWTIQRPGGETIALAATEAMQHCNGDWLWHVQADEVYSRRDARKVRELIEMYQAQPVHGFRFQVLHFYGDYDTAIDPKAGEIGWYQHTIRLARAGHGEHLGDAWTLSLGTDNIVSTDVRIYHYGHVREHEAMRRKANYMERLYHDLPESFEVCAPGEFVYDRVPETYLRPYTEPHPETMLMRVANTRLRLELAAWQRKVRKPKLLVLSRFHKVKKGYGITFNELYRTGVLQEHFEVHHLAWHYDAEPALIDGVRVYPCPEEHKLEALRHVLYELLPDVVLLHADAHFFMSYLKELKAWRGPVVGWFTVDYERRHNPAGLMSVLGHCSRILCMADASIEQTRKDYLGPIAKVPLGVNPQLFYPAVPEQKARLRQSFELPDQAFVFLMVANNFWRKGLEYAIFAFSIFCERYPAQAKDAILYLHTESSEGLKELIAANEISHKVMISPDFDPYRNPMPENRLSELYQAADAFLLTTLGEGFGMPVLESQAAGLPLIVSDNSVLREVGGEAALYIRAPGYVGGTNANAHVWLRAPDPEHAAELMFQLITQPGLRKQLVEAGQRQAREATWKRTAMLLAAELATAAAKGTLEYAPPEPVLRPV